MALVYYRLIIQGLKEFVDIPSKVKEEVRQLLIENGHEDLAIG